ncbi:hypothetical protein ACP4OV_029078 [Aristida adscensionis]
MDNVRRFTFHELEEATNSFNHCIGVGGFGNVYKGLLMDGAKRVAVRVAVKRAKPNSEQGYNEFHTEIQHLSPLHHRNLVSLFGYCDENNEMMLVYEYMDNGTLRSHLYGPENKPLLDWKQRLKVCIGAARGLHYLHTGPREPIIHRDVKSTNILLDENLLAKVADFGLAKIGPDWPETHVTTLAKGSIGYVDPEYLRNQHLTEKSDVYSFGVVLLEVLCARPATFQGSTENLADWGTKFIKGGEPQKIVDWRISDTITPDSLTKFCEIVVKCLEDKGVDRPSMVDILWNLEYVLRLQDAQPVVAGPSQRRSTVMRQIGMRPQR